MRTRCRHFLSHTFSRCIDRHRSTTRCVPSVLSVTAVRSVSLNLTVAAEWKTIDTSEHSLCLSSALRPSSGSDTSPLMHTTLSNTFSASTSDRMRSNTCVKKYVPCQIDIQIGILIQYWRSEAIIIYTIKSLYNEISKYRTHSVTEISSAIRSCPLFR